jgi:hypothetical protein
VTPFDQLSFHAFSGDSVAWLAPEEFNALPDQEIREGADRLLRSSMRTLRQPRPSSNLPLYKGQPSRAIALLTRESQRRIYYPVGEDDELVGDRGADRTIEALRLGTP